MNYSYQRIHELTRQTAKAILSSILTSISTRLLQNETAMREQHLQTWELKDHVETQYSVTLPRDLLSLFITTTIILHL